MEVNNYKRGQDVARWEVVQWLWQNPSKATEGWSEFHEKVIADTIESCSATYHEDCYEELEDYIEGVIHKVANIIEKNSDATKPEIYEEVRKQENEFLEYIRRLHTPKTKTEADSAK